MNTLLISAILLGCCLAEGSSAMIKPRIDALNNQVSYEDRLLPEYKALMEDLPTIDTSNSMSLPFGFSDRVKPLSLGDKSFAAGKFVLTESMFSMIILISLHIKQSDCKFLLRVY
jgi:hypothetical protein